MFQIDNSIKTNNFTPLKKFYDGRSVFVTGGLGFIGRVIVEKLLRTGNVREVICLVRGKRGKGVQERADKAFSGLLFSKLQEKDPDYKKRIKLVDGDLEKPGLSLSFEDEIYIIENVSVIIHSAATVKFNELLTKAISINVKGTIQLLELAKRLKHLQSFVYISTAYSYCPKEEIDEVFYPSPISINELFKFLEQINGLDPESVQKATKHRIGEWPNTYTYSKAVAEAVVYSYGTQVPLAVVRPSIVGSIAEDPIPGWTGSFQQLNGLIIGSMAGLVQLGPVKGEHIDAEIAPVDYVCNTVLAAAWKVAQDRHEKSYEPKVYHVVSYPDRPITYDLGLILIQHIRSKYPVNRILWTPSDHVMSRNCYIATLQKVYYHYIMGALVDFALLVSGRKPQLIKVYKKIHKSYSILEYFALRSWKFTNANSRQLLSSLSSEEREMYPFDYQRLDYLAYIKSVIEWAKVHFYKEPLETIPKARRKQNIMIFINRVFELLLYVGTLYLLANFWAIIMNKFEK